ncbi:MAG: hypothetical protein ACK4YV_12885 [Emticicia sp.]
MENTLDIVKLTGYSGTMTKIIAEMNPEEYKAWQIEANIEVRRTLFAKNMPLVHKHNGQIVAEYPDGKIEIIH